MNKRTATLIGFAAVVMWALLALLTAGSGAVPPFQLAAMTFLIGGCIGLASWPFRPGASRALRQRWQVWALGVAGLFGYHFFYFSAMRAAPAVEVSLIAYLWPLLLVVFSACLPGERLRLHHIFGVVSGLMGAGLVISRGELTKLAIEFSWGHLLALLCAIVWAIYSVLSRRLGRVPADVVVGYCLMTAALSGLCHLAFETTIWPDGPAQWLAVLALGLWPVGLAFYAWDIGVKHGDIMVLGVSSYAAPLLSTLLLLLAGFGVFHWSIAVASALIMGGAVLAAKDLLFPKS